MSGNTLLVIASIEAPAVLLNHCILALSGAFLSGHSSLAERNRNGLFLWITFVPQPGYVRADSGFALTFL